jgi:hypothetical protein
MVNIVGEGSLMSPNIKKRSRNFVDKDATVCDDFKKMKLFVSDSTL